jgi:hypothetical protein
MGAPDIVTVKRACQDTEVDGVIAARQSRSRDEVCAPGVTLITITEYQNVQATGMQAFLHRSCETLRCRSGH